MIPRESILRTKLLHALLSRYGTNVIGREIVTCSNLPYPTNEQLRVSTGAQIPNQWQRRDSLECKILSKTNSCNIQCLHLARSLSSYSSNVPEQPVNNSEDGEGLLYKDHYYFHPKCTEENRLAVSGSFEVVAEFFSEEEETALLQEVEPHFKRQRYEFDHWDDAIVGYRELELSRWSSRCSAAIGRLKDRAFGGGGSSLVNTHILDLSERGHIKPHVDSIRFCGSTIAGVSLSSGAVMRLVRQGDSPGQGDTTGQRDTPGQAIPGQVVDVWLPRRSLYIMRDASRYHFSHEVLENEQSRLGNTPVHRSRRVSIICRNEPV